MQLNTRLYKESNPYLQFNNDLNYEADDGRLWGFGSHSNGGGPTRKPAVFWSDDNGKSWNGPELLHGPLEPGTFTGVGDLRRRLDNTFVAVSNYATRDSQLSDVEQYTFGGARTRLRVEVDGNADGEPDATSDLHGVHGGDNTIKVNLPRNERWRLVLQFAAIDTARRPEIVGITIKPL